MNNRAGKLLRIMRYPIKGFRGEEVFQTKLNKHHSIPHDRRWAIRNGSIPQNLAHDWQPCKTFVRMTQHEDLPLYNVEYCEKSLYLTHPNGERVSINKHVNHKDKLSEWFSHNDMGLSKSNIIWQPEHGSLLNAAEQNGISITANCRSGACRSCLYRIEGEVENIIPPVSLAPNNWAYLCCAAPLSSVTIKEKSDHL